MSTLGSTFVMARRELAEKRFVFFTAIGLLLVMPLMSLAKGSMDWGRDAFIATVGGVAAIGYTLSLAILLGASTIGRDLSDKRLSFYFAKPVPASSIWFGKVLASLILIAASFLVLMAPVLLVARSAWRSSWNVNFGSLTALIALLSLALFLGSHVVSTMVRSRSALVALDAILAVFAVAIATLLVREAQELAAGLAIGMGLATVVALFLAGAWQLERARADRQRNHVELSKFVWTSVAIVLAVAAGFVGWMVRATPQSLNGFTTWTKAKNGPWMFVDGEASHRFGYHGKFLVNADDGSWYRYRPAGRYAIAAAFSGDGRHAVFLGESGPSAQRLPIYTLALDGSPAPVDTRITVTPRTGGLVLSDDGSRLALIEDRKLRVIDLPSKRTVGAARLPEGGGWLRMFFATNDVVRMYSTDTTSAGARRRSSLRIFEFDAAQHRLFETTTAPIVGHTVLPILSPDGATMLVLAHDAAEGTGRLLLADARTGQGQSISIAHSSDIFGATLIDGDRIAYVATGDNGHVLLHVTGRASAIDLGLFGHARVVRQTEKGKLVVAVTKNPPVSARESEALVVDLDRGVVERRFTGLLPEGAAFGGTDPRMPAAKPARFIAMQGKKLVRWNALTGETTPLF